MTPMQVREVFDRWGTDKGWNHHYEDFYAALPAPTSVLEIGVYQGASLSAWREIWPNCRRVVGIDINPDWQALIHRHGCDVIAGDATKEMLASGPWDLIIDDGSHVPTDQLDTWILYFEQLSERGVYVIEDVTEVALPLLGVGWELICTGDGFDDRLAVWRN